MSANLEAIRPAHSSPPPDAPSIQSDMTFTPIQAAPFTNYVENLDILRAKYSSLDDQLCPPSRSPSPIPQSRAGVLKTRFKEAIKYANYNPMSSKWSKVSGMAKMASTSRRYCGAEDGVRLGENVDVDVGHYKFVLPDTQEEWKQCEEKWEKRFEKPPAPQGTTSKYWPVENEGTKSPSKAEIVRDKVQAWQAKIVPTDPANLEIVRETDPTGSLKGKGKEVESKRQSPLPFVVAKRYAAATSSGKAAENADAVETTLEGRLSPRLSPRAPQDKPRSPTGIADLSEMEFIPPSFPQQLVTSTPSVPGKGSAVPKKFKPPPILPRQYASSPSSSPQLPNQSLERIAPPLASSSNLLPVTPSPHRVAKRIRPLTPPSESSHAVQIKKARTLPPSERFSSAPPPPTTPPIPTSPPRTPSHMSLVKGLGNAKGLPVPSTPDRRPLPTLTDLLASSRKSKPRPRPPSRKLKSAATTPAPDDCEKTKGAPTHTDLLSVVDEEREVSPAPTAASRVSRRTLLSSPASGSSGSPQSVKDRPHSPVSPLFSKTGDFAPPAVSTQVGGPSHDTFGGMAASQPHRGEPLSRRDSSAIGMGYNSQLNVEYQVDMTHDLIEKDLDYGNWLCDPYEEEANASVT